MLSNWELSDVGFNDSELENGLRSNSDIAQCSNVDEY